MLEKLRGMLKKHTDVIVYLFFGGLTTIVNYAVYWPLHNWVGLSAALSNVISWTVAVAFAFLTNKPFVFKSHDWSAVVVLPELTRFVGCRVASGLLETAAIFVFVDFLGFSGNITKIVTSILVVVLNYVTSRLLVFSSRKNKKSGH